MHRFWLLLALVQFCFQASALDLTPVHYRVGDTVREDVITPVPLIVLSPSETQAARERAAFKVPTIYRFDASVIDRVDGKFQSAFARARRHFLDALESVYSRRQVEAAELDQPRFEHVVSNFRLKEATFPVVTNLFTLWASGGADDSFQSEWLATLRRLMGQYLHPNESPDSAKTGSSRAVVILASTNSVLTRETIEAQGLFVPRSNVVGLIRARTEFLKDLTGNERDIPRYLFSFVRMNCLFDEASTEAARAAKVKDIYATDHYDAGQVILKKGELVDARGKAAWDELQIKTAAEQVRMEAAQERERAHTLLTRLAGKAVSAQLGVQAANERNYRLWIGLGATALLGAAALFVSLRRRRSTPALLPVRFHPQLEARTFGPGSAGDEAVVLSGRMTSEATWQERALRAEEAAEKARTVLRAGLMPELVRWMMTKFVAILARDRRQLLLHQRAAMEDLSALDRRLAELQTPLQERFVAYEQRIRELEVQLAVKGSENAELIKAKIALARQQLEVARSKGQVSFN